MTTRQRRHQRIVQLIEEQRIRNQEILRDLLARDGIKATQATLSRDFRDLGVSKGPTGYELPASGPPVEEMARIVQRTLERELLTAEGGGNLVVLRTRPGHGNALAVELDQARWPEVMGTVAGDDTVFVATKSPRLATSLLNRLRELAGMPG